MAQETSNAAERNKSEFQEAEVYLQRQQQRTSDWYQNVQRKELEDHERIQKLEQSEYSRSMQDQRANAEVQQLRTKLQQAEDEAQKAYQSQPPPWSSGKFQGSER